jgi:hypothetical protein
MGRSLSTRKQPTLPAIDATSRDIALHLVDMTVVAATSSVQVESCCCRCVIADGSNESLIRTSSAQEGEHRSRRLISTRRFAV